MLKNDHCEYTRLKCIMRVNTRRKRFRRRTGAHFARLSLTTTMETLGSFIKAHRKAKNLTQLELGKAVGLSRPYISNIENDCLPSTGEPPEVGADKLEKFAKVLGADYETMYNLARPTPYGFRFVREENEPQSAPELIYEPDPDLDYVIESVRGRDAQTRRMATKLLKAILDTDRTGAIGRRAGDDAGDNPE